ncbi:MAG TPA: ATP phosphoribosyltransferase regulatory subunit [Burkholderiaceae bacterium]|nr:ATP phosphoribosyltransferase regulatory subunit [Burkholderiaceae bacterium]
MTRAWLLPEQIADVLPSQARRVEELRRTLIDAARRYGFELVMPPLLEHAESLLTGTGHALDLKTFKLVDQLSGRTLGLRADTTPQVARIDAHLLNREGVTRLTYCGPVLHARADGALASRELLQFGAEIYGHAGLEADLEVIELAIDALEAAGVGEVLLDLGDARVLRAVLSGAPVDGAVLSEVVEALARKDAAAVHRLAQALPAESRAGLDALLRLYGGADVIAAARQALPRRAAVDRALDDLAWLAEHVLAAHPQVRIAFDLADLSGYAYYSGPRFALYGGNANSALARGGRYDEVGAVFGRNRPAVGFSLDVKALASSAADAPVHPAVRAPWQEDADLQAAVRRLRAEGHTVVCILPGHEHEAEEYDFDRELVAVDGQWVLRAL